MIPIIFLDPDKDDTICRVLDCDLCTKLNEVGSKLFPSDNISTKRFDIFCSLFYHKVKRHT